MNQAISGIYQNGQVHLDELPNMVAGSTSQDARKVVVVFLDEDANDVSMTTQHDKTRKLQKIMQKLCDNNSFSSITDPASWQNDIRQDKPLPR